MALNRLHKAKTTGEVATLLGVTATTVLRMCERGELEGAVRVGKWWRIPEAALKVYVTLEPSPSPSPELQPTEEVT